MYVLLCTYKFKKKKSNAGQNKDSDKEYYIFDRLTYVLCNKLKHELQNSGQGSSTSLNT